MCQDGSMTGIEAWQLMIETNLCREDSDPRFITKAADVKLRSFTTKVWPIIYVNHCSLGPSYEPCRPPGSPLSCAGMKHGIQEP